jgi:5'-AMP-activated protein kinase regulatory gamma subunit
MDTEISPQLQQQQPQESHHATVVHQLRNELTVVRRAGRQAVRAFLDSHNCFAVLKTSAKVVVFDTRIPIQLAFYALVEHGE